MLKPMHSAFYMTSLEVLLRHLQIETLILTGLTSNSCITATAHDANMRGFDIYIPEDCSCARSTREHASYTYTQAREKPGAVRQDVELTPRNAAGLVGTWERENVARIGLEAYYTGTQRLDDNPYRTQSEPYVLFGFLVEKRFGRFKTYLNAENLGNVRQTKYDPLLRTSRGPDGRWTTDAWAPLDGRVFNVGVRANF